MGVTVSRFRVGNSRFDGDGDRRVLVIDLTPEFPKKVEKSLESEKKLKKSWKVKKFKNFKKKHESSEKF